MASKILCYALIVVLLSTSVASSKDFRIDLPEIEDYSASFVILDRIALGEGTSNERAQKAGFEDGYDVPFSYGSYGKPSKALTDMTISEIQAYQDQMIANGATSGAVGRYQITKGTLADLISRYKIESDALFDVSMQDKLAIIILKECKYNKWMDGTVTDDEFQYNLAGRWASIENPHNPGSSRYPKQSVGTTIKDLQAVMDQTENIRKEDVQIKSGESYRTASSANALDESDGQSTGTDVTSHSSSIHVDDASFGDIQEPARATSPEKETLGQAASRLAKSVVGTPYYPAAGYKGNKLLESAEIMGDDNPGIDCSGLIFWAFNRANGEEKITPEDPNDYCIGCPIGSLIANYQMLDEKRIKIISKESIPDKSKLQPGDLLWIDTEQITKGCKYGKGCIDHVAMYVGDNKVVHASGSNEITKKSKDKIGEIISDPVIDTKSGITWWKVRYRDDGTEGWSAESHLGLASVDNANSDQTGVIKLVKGDLIKTIKDTTTVRSTPAIEGAVTELTLEQFWDLPGPKSNTKYRDYFYGYGRLVSADKSVNNPAIKSPVGSQKTIESDTQEKAKSIYKSDLKQSTSEQAKDNPDIGESSKDSIQLKNEKFSAGDKVVVTDNLNVRDAPGLSSSTVISSKVAGTLATILSEQPVYADDFAWWQIQYDDGTIGWSQEKRLELKQIETQNLEQPKSLPSEEFGKIYQSNEQISDIKQGLEPISQAISSSTADDVQFGHAEDSSYNEEQKEIREKQFGYEDTSLSSSDSSSNEQSREFGSESEKNDLGGINFTSIKLNYISVSVNDSGRVNFDLILKAKKAEGNTSGIDLINNTRISAIAFMTGLAVHDNKFWVNLNPWEADRIIDKELEQSDVGRIMLEADLQMKKDFSNYENPCTNETGKALWGLLEKKREALAQQCMSKFPGEVRNIDSIRFRPVTRHWIIPDKVYAYTNGSQIYIINSTLTISSEPIADHSAFELKDQDIGTLSNGCLEELNRSAKEYGEYYKDLNDHMILPYVISDVNSAERYEDLRNVYTALALAQWYKSSITSRRDIFRGNLTSLDINIQKALEPWNAEDIWNEYVISFRNGEYKCWENETIETATKITYRNESKSSGGVEFGKIRANLVGINKLPKEIEDQAKKVFMYGSVHEGNDVLFGERFHLYMKEDDSALGLNSIANTTIIDPELSMLWLSKGSDLDKQGRSGEAVEALDEAIRLYPKNAAVWAYKGLILSNLSRYDEAIQAYDESIKLDPKNSMIWSNKGSALSSLGKYNEAAEAFDEAIRLK